MNFGRLVQKLVTHPLFKIFFYSHLQKSYVKSVNKKEDSVGKSNEMTLIFGSFSVGCNHLIIVGYNCHILHGYNDHFFLTDPV